MALDKLLAFSFLSFLIFKIGILNQYLPPRVVGGKIKKGLYKVQQWHVISSQYCELLMDGGWGEQENKAVLSTHGDQLAHGSLLALCGLIKPTEPHFPTSVKKRGLRVGKDIGN